MMWIVTLTTTTALVFGLYIDYSDLEIVMPQSLADFYISSSRLKLFLIWYKKHKIKLKLEGYFFYSYMEDKIKELFQSPLSWQISFYADCFFSNPVLKEKIKVYIYFTGYCGLCVCRGSYTHAQEDGEVSFILLKTIKFKLQFCTFTRTV